jgi:hypothetical protein
MSDITLGDTLNPLEEDELPGNFRRIACSRRNSLGKRWLTDELAWTIGMVSSFTPVPQDDLPIGNKI